MHESFHNKNAVHFDLKPDLSLTAKRVQRTGMVGVHTLQCCTVRVAARIRTRRNSACRDAVQGIEVAVSTNYKRQYLYLSEEYFLQG